MLDFPAGKTIEQKSYDVQGLLVVIRLVWSVLRREIERHRHDPDSFAISQRFLEGNGISSGSHVKSLFDHFFELTFEAKEGLCNGYRLRYSIGYESHDPTDCRVILAWKNLYHTNPVCFTQNDLRKKLGMSARDSRKVTPRRVLQIVIKKDNAKIKKCRDTPTGVYTKIRHVPTEEKLRAALLSHESYHHAIYLTKSLEAYPYQEYEKKDNSGRLFAKAHNDEIRHNLQNAKKEIRRLFFPNCFLYDIDQCAPTILYHSALIWELIKEGDLPCLNALLTDKHGQRERYRDQYMSLRPELSQEEAMKDIKRTITSLFFGATLTEHPSCENFQTLGDEKLRSITQVLGTISEEISKLSKKLSGYLKKHYCEGNIFKNPNAGESEYKRSSQLCSRYFQGVESKVLEAIYARYAPNLGLLIHDGLISYKKLDVQELNDLALKATGIPLTFSKELIGGYEPANNIDRDARQKVA